MNLALALGLSLGYVLAQGGEFTLLDFLEMLVAIPLGIAAAFLLLMGVIAAVEAWRNT